MAHLDDLAAEVERNKTVTASVLALIAGLAKQIADNVNDPVALAKLASDLKASSDSLAEAVVANTPPVPPLTP